MDESCVAPELEPVDRTHGGGELDTFACDFAGDDRLRRAYRDEHITLDDIVKGDGPFRPVVPEKLFSARFVYPRTCQLQRGPWRDGKNGSYSRIVRGCVHTIEGQAGNRLIRIGGTIGHRLPANGKGQSSGNRAVSIDAVSGQSEPLDAHTAD